MYCDAVIGLTVNAANETVTPFLVKTKSERFTPETASEKFTVTTPTDVLRGSGATFTVPATIVGATESWNQRSIESCRTTFFTRVIAMLFSDTPKTGIDEKIRSSIRLLATFGTNSQSSDEFAATRYKFPARSKMEPSAVRVNEYSPSMSDKPVSLRSIAYSRA